MLSKLFFRHLYVFFGFALCLIHEATTQLSAEGRSSAKTALKDHLFESFHKTLTLILEHVKHGINVALSRRGS